MMLSLFICIGIYSSDLATDGQYFSTTYASPTAFGFTCTDKKSHDSIMHSFLRLEQVLKATPTTAVSSS